jgi:hypothetical protein
MKKKNKQPIMRSHLPLILLGVVMAGYGVVSALVGSIYASQAMRGLISTGVYRSRLAAFDQAAGLIAGILILGLFIWCAVVSNGIVRAAFAIGVVSSFAPILAARAENLLFNVIGLPTMSAGSVMAGLVTTLVLSIPLMILFILLACAGRIPTGCRWLSLASIFAVLITAFYPIYVTLLAFLLKPGDPTVGQMIQVSSQVIKLRYFLPGLSFLFLALISLRFSRKQESAGEGFLPQPAESSN